MKNFTFQLADITGEYFGDLGQAGDVIITQEQEILSGSYHTYKFVVQGLASEYVAGPPLVEPVDADFDEMTPIQLSIAIDDEKEFDYPGNVRVTPVGSGAFQFWAKDSKGDWYDINDVGWGPGPGFPIDLGAETNIYVVATDIFEGDITFELEDVSGEYLGDLGEVGDIIISQVESITSIGPVLLYDGDPDASGNLVSSHMTIQEAIDEADDNYYITVGAGTYAENLDFSGNNGLTLRGAQAGVSAGADEGVTRNEKHNRW